MQRTLALLSLAVLAIPATAVVAKRPNWRAYRHRVVSKRTMARSAGRAAVGQAFNAPREWGRGPAGFAKRFGSGVATHAVKTGIQMGVGALHHENLHYQRSNQRGTLPRLGHAVKSTFIVPRTNRRGKTVALGRVSGAMGAGMISRVWQPASAAGVGAGVASGGIALGADVGVNVAREFWPRKKPRRQVASTRHRRR